MARHAVQDLFDEMIKPHLAVVRQMMQDNRTTREICNMLKVDMGIWKLCRRHCPELAQVVEDIKGQNSVFYEKVLPFFDDIEEWMVAGFTMSQIQEKLGLRGNPFRIYTKIYPYFKEFLEHCQELKNERIKDSVYKRANGYLYEEKKESIEEGEYIYDNDGKEVYETNPDGSVKMKDGRPVHKRKKGKIKLEKTTREMPSDISAATIYLANESNWTRKDKEDERDPIKVAEDIKQYLEEMDSKVPEAPKMTNMERVMDLLSNMTKNELKSIVPLINRVANDLS